MLFAAISIISLYLSRDSISTFLRIIFYVVLIGVVFALVIVFYALNQGESKRTKKKRAQKRVGSAYKISVGSKESIYKDRDKSLNSSRLSKKNFNWSEEDILRNSKVNEQNPEPVIHEDKPKFVPYRSPFVSTISRHEDKETEVCKEEALQETAASEQLLDEIVQEPFPGYDFGELQEDALTAEQYKEEPEEFFEEIDNVPHILMEEECNVEEDEEIPEDDKEESGTEKSDKERRVVRLILKSKNRIAYDKTAAASNKTVISDRQRAQLHVRPSIDLLNKPANSVESEQESDIHADYNAKKLIDTLASFGVGAKVINVSQGPTVTRYEIQPNAGVKVSKIVNLSDDIALNLAATGVRIEAPIPGKAAIGIEVPNKEVVPVLLRDVIESEEFKNHPSKLAFAVGKDVAGNNIVGDIAKMPHLLIAGATGSGKSVCINTLIASILYKASPTDVRLLMVDPKVVELGIYNGIPHLLIPVVTDPKKAAGALNWAVQEMTNRYKLFAESNVRDLKGYNTMIKERGEGNILPQIVIIIDELADLMMVAPNEVEDCICRLAQMARAAGMHLVIATQRPSVDVITGVIKANVPSRISFAVSSQIDSRTILDMAGAEKLLGRGDMLFNPIGEPKPIRVQGGFISDKEVEAIVTHLKSDGTVQYDEEIMQKIESQGETSKADPSNDDDLLPQAIDMVIEHGQASVSLIQRKFKVGYSRAARILDQMEAWGVVSGYDGSKPRQILVTRSEWEELNA